MKKLLVIFLTLTTVMTAIYADSVSKKTLSLGFMPYISPSILLEKYTPLAKYLSQELNTKVEIKIAKNYTEHLENVKNDKYDIAFLGGSPYIYLADNFNKKRVLVRYEFNGLASFRSVIFVNQNSKIKDIKELEGKYIAFGNKKSTLSSQVPMYMLKNANVDIEQCDFKFLNNHENVFLGVLFGEYQAGAIAEDIFLENKDRGIRAIAYSPRVSTHVFTASDKLSEKDAKSIKNALLSLKDKKVLTSVSKNLSAFVDVKDEDYDLLRDILTEVLPILENR